MFTKDTKITQYLYFSVLKSLTFTKKYTIISLENLIKAVNTMYTIGVDLGGTNIAIGICNENLEIIEKGSVPTKANRDGELIIPDGNFELKAGDVISLTASPNDMQKLLKSLGILKKESRNIMLMGGGKTSYYLAKQLLASGSDVKIVEKREDRCLRLSESLPNAVLIHGDGTHQELLLEEGLRSLDAFVTLTGMDEENILTGLFASAQNVPQVISKVNRDELASMAERLGLDYTISTKTITSDLVLSYARALENSRGSNIETLYKIMDGKAEALEFNVKPDSEVIGTPLKDMKIKSGILIAGIIRSEKKAVIPTGNDSIQKGDKVIVLAADRRLSDLDDILR